MPVKMAQINVCQECGKYCSDRKKELTMNKYITKSTSY
jgi:ribosome-binding protein aMBF1 (putative translation factor)